MAAPKTQTLQARFGFQDSELSTPKHDEMMLWLDNWLDNNFCGLLAWRRVHIYVKDNYRHSVELEKFPRSLPQFPTIWEISKIWEKPITDKSYTIGFCDMVVNYKHPELQFHEDKCGFEITKSYNTEYCFFEVKPVIPSLGELIRQIRMYTTYTDLLHYDEFDHRSFAPPPKWYIVSPDDRFKDALASQGIGFVKYPGQ